ncbi:uncharacterized protein BP5553_00780 [Venustampulla echinocandica]|uniref:Uncharacterized protein n=1 Tax=Venustampulla echinocandica TaxID=2656787 RepID=A0A370TZ37_9HELO|nr:uncharacterized protein BP5553_00780 [Venustampulla echinocandica]RDL40801.1 hypothetical protein BP5553_00780 [Venustampulla echinocandica]
MAYSAIAQAEHKHSQDASSISSASPAPGDAPPRARAPSTQLASPVFAPRLGLFWDDDGKTSSHDENASASTSGLGQMVQSFTLTTRSRNTSGSYDLLEGDDFAHDAPASPVTSGHEKLEKPKPDHHQGSQPPPHDSSKASAPLHIPRPLPPPISRPQPQESGRTSASNTTAVFAPSPSVPLKPIIRTASGRSTVLRHPTPDLQVLQGAYTGNIEHLERTAERLSMTSSIDNAIKELHDEQKRSDSRKSSLISFPDLSAMSRQLSNASSIIEVNSAARSGGFSPAGFVVSPKGSFTAGPAGRLRSGSKSSRFGNRPEPELEGRPLDSFVNMTASTRSTSPVLSTAAPVDKIDENSVTLTRPVVDLLDDSDNTAPHKQPLQPSGEYRPGTSASTNTYDVAHTMFEGFDGVHTEPPLQLMDLVGESNEPNNTQRRLSSANRLSMARPQTYADPDTGQQMVYYPAPVPMMLNLPHKLSKAPSSMARNKRRSEVLSNIPAAARQSAIWLPDVLEDDLSMPEDVENQQQEYLPQHQRTTMGGRRNTRDLDHLPPQLRASTFFDLPAPAEIVEMKEQSAVATLDSILDASAHAPVGAFTDHTFAGHLGAEVYGRPAAKHNRSSTQLLDTQQKKRTSSFNILRGKRSSSNLLDADKEKDRPATMSEIQDAGKRRSPIEGSDDEGLNNDTAHLNHSEAGDGQDGVGSGESAVLDESGDEEQEGQSDDDIYHGPPTTLLAELQLRKQQQKQRTRPTASAYPNGMHSTLLELDAVAQVEQQSRKQKRVNLAWEPPAIEEPDDGGDDEDVPLAMLYSKKAHDLNRPLGLMERREIEDNEPLSRRRDRLTGRPVAAHRASTMMHLSPAVEPEDENETLAQRSRRLKGGPANGLPSARPVSGDFASEMMSQFGGDALDSGIKSDAKGKGHETAFLAPEDETLGQRRKRLQAEQARGSGGALHQRRSMADILQAVPSNSADVAASQARPLGGLLGLHEQEMAKRSSTMFNLDPKQPAGPQRNPPGGFRNGMYSDGHAGIAPQQAPQQNMYGYGAPFPQPSLGFNGFNGFNQSMMPFQNQYAAGFPPNAMQLGYMSNMQPNPMMHMGMGAGVQPLNQGQIDMVERWRQSVMQ